MAKILSIEPIKCNRARYDIETETHNYFANNVHVHNCNFSFLVNGQEVIPAKRSSTLGVTAHGTYDFYGCNPVVEEYSDAMVQLSNVIGGPIQVFGELYGEGVQKEVNYGKKDFIAYDIMLEDGTFLDWPRVRDLCMIFGIPTTPERGRGTLEEILSLSPEFASWLSPTGDNAEGVVIKPLVSDMRLHTGSRPIIKNKSKAFSEKKQKVAKQPKKLDEELVPLFEDFCTYITENRLRNILSKVGEVTQKDFGRVMGMFVQDAKEEFERDEYEIPKDHWKEISKPVSKEASNVLRLHWLDILDNNF